MTLRQTARVLALREFRLLYLARVTSQFGNQMTPVALVFGILELTGSASTAGLALAVEGVALAATLLFGGVIADRLPRRNVMISADLVRFMTQGLIAVLFLAGIANIGVLLALQAASGIASALFIPAVTALQPETVPPPLRQDANALRGLSFALSGIGGPAIAGVLVATIGTGAALAVDAATFGVSALIISRIQVGRTRRLTTRGVMGELRDGWDEFRSRTWLWAVVIQGGLVRMFALAPFIVLGAAIAEAELGGVGAWSLILTANGVGSLLGAVTSGRIRPQRPLQIAVCSALGFVPMLICLALGLPVPMVAGVAVLGGAAQTIFWTLWQTALQQYVPSQMLARVSSYDWLAGFAFMPAGYALAGPVAAFLGPGRALLAGAVAVVITTLATLAVSGVRRTGDELSAAADSAQAGQRY